MLLTEQDIKHILKECVNRIILVENQESDSQHKAMALAMQNGMSKEEANEFVRVTLRNDLPSLRSKDGGKFTLGAARMFFNRELTNAKTINSLNQIIKLISEKYYNDFDKNLNELSAQDLISKFEDEMADSVNQDRESLSKQSFNKNNDYKIVPINSFEKASEYHKYFNGRNNSGTWCITHMNNMFKSYTNEGLNQIYFCLKNGFEDMEPVRGDNCPLDEFGLSMISVIVNENGGLAYSTCRWNHENHGDDNILTTEQISKLLGINFYDVFKANDRWQMIVSDAEQRLMNGEDPEDVFEWTYALKNGYTVVQLKDKENIINTDGNIISKQWFDRVDYFENGYAIVELTNKQNLIDTDGNLLLKQWFEWVGRFRNGYAQVRLNDRYNFIDTKGEILSKQWFDSIGRFSDGYAQVKINRKWNFIDAECNFLSKQGFDMAYSFNDGYAIVAINDKWNFIDTKGNILSKEWFDNAGGFSDGYATVALNNKQNLIDTNGNTVSKQWFDWIGDFNNGYSKVRLDDKSNLIDSDGNLVSKQWFDRISGFNNGYASVILNDKYNLIDTNGNILSKEWLDTLDGLIEFRQNIKNKYM